ncbi:MAG: hypothetical protein JJ864_05425 [Rhizobiaceae bacterium]|nr:hypothetical protein [Rhizobiaceae bacterium]
MTPEEVIDTYATAWGEPDPGRRKAILEQVLTPGCTYTDPRVHAANPAELSDHIGRILPSRPGAKVLRISAVDMHHGKARFAWHMVNADGTALPAGLDIVEFDEATGKLKTILGFFDPLPELG